MHVIAGIYPGISNLMAAHMISIARREYNADWTYAETSSSSASASSSTSNRQQGAAREAGAGSSGSGGAEREREAAPLRSGIATMEPDEGGQPLEVYALHWCASLRGRAAAMRPNTRGACSFTRRIVQRSTMRRGGGSPCNCMSFSSYAFLLQDTSVLVALLCWVTTLGACGRRGR